MTGTLQNTSSRTQKLTFKLVAFFCLISFKVDLLKMASTDSEDYEFASDDNSSSNGDKNPIFEPVSSAETSEKFPTDEQNTSNDPDSGPQDYDFDSDYNSSSNGNKNPVFEPVNSTETTEMVPTNEQNTSNCSESESQDYEFDPEPESKCIH